MAVKNYYGVRGTLAQAISSVSTLIQVDASTAGAIAATFVNGSDEAWFSIRAGNTYELVKVTNVSGAMLAVDRDESGTGAQSFPNGSTFEFEITSQGILAEIGTVSTAVQITGSGQADVSNPELNEFNVNVPTPTISGMGGIDILGAWPAITVAYAAPEGDCCGGSGGGTGGGIVELEGSGIATAYASGGVGYVSVAAPNFTEGANITITGTWPNITFSAAAGGGGSVTSVAAGAGITVTGTPTVNPTVAITNTGVAAGTYGEVAVNARGQFTSIAATFNPVSAIVAGDGLGAVRTGASVKLDVDTAAVGIPGIAPLADHTDPFDPNDDASIATPAVVAAALAALPAVDAVGADSYVGESDGDYTNVISGSNTAVNIGASEKALVYAEVTMVDGSTPETPVQYGLAVFSSAPAKIRSSRSVTQSTQNMMFIVEGPVNTTLAIATTAVPGGASVTSYSLAVILI